MIADAEEYLVEGARELGILLTRDQRSACLVFLAELTKWNRKINLTAIRDDREVIIKHFLDSFTFLKDFEAKPGSSLIDMGSGAGFPALPIKIVAPSLNIAMVESVKKKASFLRHIVRALGLQGVDIIDQHTSKISPMFFGKFDIATARAFAEMEKALKEGTRFLTSGGILVLSRGPEETIGEKEIECAGMELKSRTALALPFSGDRRSLWVFRKKR